jgi:monoamine oxidase
MDLIAKAFELRVSDNIIYQAQVSQIRKTATGAQIVYLDQNATQVSLEADYCICTTPTGVLKNIDSDCSTSHQIAIDNFVYTKACKIAFQSRRFWEQDHSIYGGISWTNRNITQLWYPNGGLGRDQGVIVGAYTFSDAAGNSFANMSPAKQVVNGHCTSEQSSPRIWQ